MAVCPTFELSKLSTVPSMEKPQFSGYGEGSPIMSLAAQEPPREEPAREDLPPVPPLEPSPDASKGSKSDATRPAGTSASTDASHPASIDSFLRPAPVDITVEPSDIAPWF